MPAQPASGTLRAHVGIIYLFSRNEREGEKKRTAYRSGSHMELRGKIVHPVLHSSPRDGAKIVCVGDVRTPGKLVANPATCCSIKLSYISANIFRERAECLS